MANNNQPKPRSADTVHSKDNKGSKGFGQFAGQDYDDVHQFLNILFNQDPRYGAAVFNMMTELASSSANQNSRAAITLQTILDNLSIEETEKLTKMLNAVSDNNEEVTDNERKTGYEGWDDTTRKEKRTAKTDEEAKAHGGTKAGDEYEVIVPGGTREQMFGKPVIKNTAARAALNGIVLPSLSTASATIGKSLFDRHKGIADYYSVLGDAMHAMANRNDSISNPTLKRAYSAYYNKKGALEKANAAKELAKGAQQNDVATGIASALNNIAKVNNARDEAARQAQLMINEHPVSDFYRDSASIRRWANNDGGTK